VVRLVDHVATVTFVTGGRVWPARVWALPASADAYAIKDCVDADAPTPLSLHLQGWICVESTLCGWVTLTSGLGSVSYTCPASYLAVRSSRLPSKVLYCP
jgi:hypothetical protein